jgi:hypothetical protein
MSRPRVLLAVGFLAGVRPPFVAAWMSRVETPGPVPVPEVVALVLEGPFVCLCLSRNDRWQPIKMVH